MAEESGKSEAQDSGGFQRPPEEDSEEAPTGAPAWMATFADMVTLLLCFFILLFAMSSTQEESFKELIKSLKSALGVQQVPEAGTREGLTMHQIPKEEKTVEAVDEAGAMVQKEIDQIVTDVRELIMFNQLGGMVRVEGDEMGATITISDVLLFPAGEATMSSEGLKLMKKIANVISQFRYQIKVVGYTDNAPISTAVYPSNWELSTSRACEVVRYFIDQGIDPHQLAAVGYGPYRPIATNDTPEGRAKNRRVEIIYERQEIAQGISGNKR